MHFCLTIAIPLLASAGLEAHTLRSRIASAQASDGSQRQRMRSDLNLNLNHSGFLTSSTFGLSASRERSDKRETSEEEIEVYGTTRRQTDSLNFNAGQNWSKIWDTRLLSGYSTDGVMKSRTFGAGTSLWTMKENLQLSFDASRTVVDQPVFEILGADSDIISPPELLTSTGLTFASKLLVSPTTVATLSYTNVEKNDRPPTHVYASGVKQYIKPTKSAIHIDGARVFNQGRVTTASTYGEVNAWIAEAAWLQQLWKGAVSKLTYRYYREDEATRVDQDLYTRGSDFVGLGFAQDLQVGDSVPWTVETNASQYKTNALDEDRKVTAKIFEMGLTAKF